MKTFITYCLLLISFCAYSQHKETTVSISCYVNPELYLRGGVISFVSNNAGNYSCKGKHVTIYNGSDFPFYYRLSANTKKWVEIKPYKQVIIPVSSSTTISSGLSVVRLYAKYREDISGNLSLKIKTIAKMNAESDKVKARELRGSVERPSKGNAVAGRKSPPKSTQEARRKTPAVKESEKVAKRSAEKTLISKPKESEKRSTTKITSNASVADTLRDSTMNYCYYASDTAYYSFYYIKIRDTVLYSYPFPVEKYEDEPYGQRVLYNAWGCLSEKIIQQFGEPRYNAYLNDVNYDLMTGFQHIRNPHIPSDTIINEYPYTKTFISAETELKTWIKNEKALDKDVKFIEVGFP